MRARRVADSVAVSSPLTAASATFALNSEACCPRSDNPVLLLVGDRQTADQSLCQPSAYGGAFKNRSDTSPTR
ncbi:hypothetical protein SAMN05519105_1349 [Rhodobacter sp. 24-YEA-8]|nr:hypothetical protein SAMN05519105_1349 [Rhodobacter sp. 24-YEA-8]